MKFTVIDATTAQHPSGFVATLDAHTLSLADGSDVTTVPWRLSNDHRALVFTLSGANPATVARVLAWAACFGLPVVLEQAPPAAGEALALLVPELDPSVSACAMWLAAANLNSTVLTSFGEITTGADTTTVRLFGARNHDGDQIELTIPRREFDDAVVTHLARRGWAVQMDDLHLAGDVDAILKDFAVLEVAITVLTDSSCLLMCVGESYGLLMLSVGQVRCSRRLKPEELLAAWLDELRCLELGEEYDELQVIVEQPDESTVFTIAAADVDTLRELLQPLFDRL